MITISDLNNINLQKRINNKIKYPQDLKKDCWIWNGNSFDKNNFSLIYIKGRNYPVHRIIFQIQNQIILKKDQKLIKLCNDIFCVNPYHYTLDSKIKIKNTNYSKEELINYIKKEFKNYNYNSWPNLISFRKFPNNEKIINVIDYYLIKDNLNEINSISEKLYLILKNLKEIPKCKRPSCQKNSSFRKFIFGYNQYCTYECRKKHFYETLLTSNRLNGLYEPVFSIDNYNGVKNYKYSWKCLKCNNIFR